VKCKDYVCQSEPASKLWDLCAGCIHETGTGCLIHGPNNKTDLVHSPVVMRGKKGSRITGVLK
jgi:hypothetical protein